MNHGSQINRKQFIRRSAVTGLMLALGDLSAVAAPAGRLNRVGLITNVIGKQLREDWEGTLRHVAAIGYRHLEFGGHFGSSPATFLQFLKETGLMPLAGGSAMAQLKKEGALARIVDESLAMEKQYLVCYWPWMDDGKNKKTDDFRKAADDLNGIGRECTRRGIRFAFHNHDKEFVPVEGFGSGYELLMEETDPAHVCMLLDLYWCVKGGADPVRLLQRYPGRVELFHVKDMDKTAERSFTCPGYGSIDFRTIFRHAASSGVKHYTVEIDEAADPVKCIEDSFKYLSNLRF